MEEEDKPILDLTSEGGAAPFKQWKPSEETEEQVLQIVQGILPTDLRASDAQFEEFYQRAYNLYNAGRYKDALPFFNILCMGKPQDARFYVALAATHHMLKEYAEAANFYSLSCIWDPNNPKIHYHLADCWLHMEELPNAFISLQMGIELAGNTPKHKAIKDRMGQMLKRVENELNEKKSRGVTNFRGTYGNDPMKVIKETLNLPDDVAELDKIIKEGEVQR